MMRFDIMTLFPDLVKTILGESIIGRAQATGAIEIHEWDIRDYSENKHRRVDDTPYGGGYGMLMAAPPIRNCYDAVISSSPVSNRKCVIYMSPKGMVLKQDIALEFSQKFDQIIILCGHYEGVDCRIIEEIVDAEISIGDFVLTGGEIPACIFVDCISRLCDGVLSAPECYSCESLSDGLLEYPQYTRPYDYHGMLVPDVLISGHHENIRKWRNEQSYEETLKKRPELIKNAEKE